MPLIGLFYIDSVTLLFLFDHFLEARAEIFRWFLVNLKTPKGHFKINWPLKPVLNMSIVNELRLQKKRKIYSSHRHSNFGHVKVAKSRKVFFYFWLNSGWVRLVGLVVTFDHTITVFLKMRRKRKYLPRFSVLYYIQVNKEMDWWLTPKTSHSSVDSAKKEKYIQYIDSHHSK